MSRTCERTFPLPRIHTGAGQANGTMGVAYAARLLGIRAVIVII